MPFYSLTNALWLPDFVQKMAFVENMNDESDDGVDLIRAFVNKRRAQRSLGGRGIRGQNTFTCFKKFEFSSLWATIVQNENLNYIKH